MKDEKSREKTFKFLQGYLYSLSQNEADKIIEGRARMLDENEMDEDEKETITYRILNEPNVKTTYKRFYRQIKYCH